MLVDTAVTVFVNVAPLIDDTDFKTRETAIAYNQTGMDLVWNFCTPAGVITQTAVTPTTAGDYDWTHVGDGMYKIEIPASGGASINNNTEGYGFFSGVCDGVLPWAGPTYTFAPANVVNALVVGSDNLQVDLAQWLGSAPAALVDTNKVQVSLQHGATDVITSDLIATDAIGASELAAGAATEIADAVWASTTRTLTAFSFVVSANLIQISSDAQSATDLKDFADAGYDPVTNKVEGVKLVDTTTANSDMRGTDNAALASVLGALNDAAAAGDPTATDTVVAYLKQLINTLEGTAGVPIFPAETGPANNVSLAEVIRAIHADVTGLNGAAMRGTDSAALASVCTEARLSELDAATGGKAANQIDVIEGKFSGMTSLAQWLGAMAGKQTGNATARTEIRATGAGSGTFDETKDSQEAIRDNQSGGGGGGLSQTDAVSDEGAGTIGNAFSLIVNAATTLNLSPDTILNTGHLKTIYTDAAWTHTITLTSALPATRDKLWFTAKSSESDADSAAQIQIEETGGLMRINGSAATSTDGSMTVAGDRLSITLTLKAAAAGQLSKANLFYDVKVKETGQEPTVVSAPFQGLPVVLSVTKATS